MIEFEIDDQFCVGHYKHKIQHEDLFDEIAYFPQLQRNENNQ